MTRTLQCDAVESRSAASHTANAPRHHASHRATTLAEDPLSSPSPPHCVRHLKICYYLSILTDPALAWCGEEPLSLLNTSLSSPLNNTTTLTLRAFCGTRKPMSSGRAIATTNIVATSGSRRDMAGVGGVTGKFSQLSPEVETLKSHSSPVEWGHVFSVICCIFVAS
jgi:hypothetical protein